jgi:hypothetical protein
MTREEAKKRILGVFLNELEADDEALFGPDAIEGERDYPAFDGARKELLVEFKRRTAGHG